MLQGKLWKISQNEYIVFVHENVDAFNDIYFKKDFKYSTIHLKILMILGYNWRKAVWTLAWNKCFIFLHQTALFCQIFWLMWGSKFTQIDKNVSLFWNFNVICIRCKLLKLFCVIFVANMFDGLIWTKTQTIWTNARLHFVSINITSCKCWPIAFFLVIYYLYLLVVNANTFPIFHQIVSFCSYFIAF